MGNYTNNYFEDILLKDNNLYFLRENGFDIFSYTNPNNNELIARYTSNDTPNIGIFHDSILFLLCFDSILVLNISNLLDIKLIDRYNLVGGDKFGKFTYGVYEDNYLYLTKTAYFHYERTYFFFKVKENIGKFTAIRNSSITS